MKAERTILIMAVDVTGRREEAKRLLTLVRELSGTSMCLDVADDERTPLETIPPAAMLTRLPPTRDELTAAIDQSQERWLKVEELIAFVQDNVSQIGTWEVKALNRMFSSVVFSGLVGTIDPGNTRSQNKFQMVRLADCVSLVNDARYPGIVRNLGTKTGPVFKAWIEMEYNRVVWPEKHIDELGLSSRARNALVQNGVHTIAQLLQKSAVDLGAMPGMGEESLKEVESNLVACGLQLSPYEPKPLY